MVRPTNPTNLPSFVPVMISGNLYLDHMFRQERTVNVNPQLCTSRLWLKYLISAHSNISVIISISNNLGKHSIALTSKSRLT